MAKKSKSSPALPTVSLDGVTVRLAQPDNFPAKITGADEVRRQLAACWLKLREDDVPLSPRVMGPPGVGKTTIAYGVAQSLKRPVYVFQCTMDTRPEDLIITPVIGEKQRIVYQASPLVSAMVTGGICILDEGNRMSEKAWASLAPLLDHRRYVESIVAGIKVKAHVEFRTCVTMNDDASTYEIPEYIMSRLQPLLVVEFPRWEEEQAIMKVNLPLVDDELLMLIAKFLERAHNFGEPFATRDGISMARFAVRLMEQGGLPRDQALEQAAVAVVGREGARYLDPEFKPSRRPSDQPAYNPVQTDPEMLDLLMRFGQSSEGFHPEDEDEDDLPSR